MTTNNLGAHLTTNPKIIQIDSLGAFTDFIENNSKETPNPFWYRGCGKASHELRPRLYRHPTTTDVDGLMELEGRLLTRFKQRSVPYLSRTQLDDWEYLFW